MRCRAFSTAGNVLDHSVFENLNYWLDAERRPVQLAGTAWSYKMIRTNRHVFSFDHMLVNLDSVQADMREQDVQQSWSGDCSKSNAAGDGGGSKTSKTCSGEIAFLPANRFLRVFCGVEDLAGKFHLQYKSPILRPVRGPGLQKFGFDGRGQGCYKEHLVRNDMPFAMNLSSQYPGDVLPGGNVEVTTTTEAPVQIGNALVVTTWVGVFFLQVIRISLVLSVAASLTGVVMIVDVVLIFPKEEVPQTLVPRPARRPPRPPPPGAPRISIRFFGAPVRVCVWPAWCVFGRRAGAT